MLRIKALASSWGVSGGRPGWWPWVVATIRPRLEVTQFYRGLKRIHVIEALELSEEQNRWDGGMVGVGTQGFPKNDSNLIQRV